MGRPRKTSVKRERNGRVQRQPDRVHPETVVRRQTELERDGIDPKHALDALAGFTLGRLRLRGDITQEQYHAGEKWAAIVRRHSVIMGYELSRTPKAASMEIGGGTSCRADPDDRQVGDIRDRFRICYDALVMQPLGWQIAEVCFGVAIENWPIERVHIFALRRGLDTLARVLK